MPERKGPGSMICPSCGRLIARNATSCPYCNHAFPGMLGLSTPLARFFEGERFHRIFLFISLVLFGVTLAASRGADTEGFLTPSLPVLVRAGAQSSPLIWEGQWWRLILPMFLHGGFIHILCNMMWLQMIGHLVEKMFGSARFVLLYLGAGFCGSLCSFLLNDSRSVGVGASGAIFGLITASIMIGHRQGGERGASLKRQMTFYAILVFGIGLVIPVTDNWAHAGGAAAGFVFGAAFGFRDQTIGGESPRLRLAAVFALLIGIIAFAFTVIHAASHTTEETLNERFHESLEMGLANALRNTETCLTTMLEEKALGKDDRSTVERVLESTSLKFERWQESLESAKAPIPEFGLEPSEFSRILRVIKRQLQSGESVVRLSPDVERLLGVVKTLRTFLPQPPPRDSR